MSQARAVAITPNERSVGEIPFSPVPENDDGLHAHVQAIGSKAAFPADARDVTQIVPPAAESDVDDHDATLTFLGGYRRLLGLVLMWRLERQFQPATPFFPTSLVFAAANFFNDPGVQHGVTFARGPL
jgi:hypothetical protein